MTFTTRPELRGTFGAVASTHWLASTAGMGVLERGGNAFDAACAAGFVLQVVEPHLNGPGGDLPAVIWPAELGEPLVLCAQGVSPQPRRSSGSARSGTSSCRHRPARGVRPRLVRRLAAAARAVRDWRLEDVLAYAIGYAEDGYPGRARDRGDDPERRSAAARLAGLGRAVPASAAARTDVPEPRACRDMAARARRSTGRLARGRDRARPARLLRGLRGGGDRPLLTRRRRAPDRRRPRRVAGDVRGAGDRRLPRADGVQDGGVGAGAGGLAAADAARGIRRRRASARPSSCTSSPRRRSSRSPTATRATATPTFRSTGCSPAEYADERRQLIGSDASGELRPGLGRLPALVADGRRAGRRRGADARRHRPRRRRRPVREHALGNAERRLAAELADDPRARLAARHARADVLARGGIAVVARAGQATRGRRFRRGSCCATASRGSPTARRAATSRSSGRCTRSCGTSTAG